MKYLACFLTLTAALGASEANAQVVMDRAATAGESYARGASDMMRARGDANLSNSQAAINAQDAYSAAIDNSVKSVNAYWEKRDIYNDRRAQENYEMGKRRARRIEKNRVQPLTTEEFDRTSGKIGWPKVLMQSQYDEYRNTLDELFQTRADNGYLSSDDYLAAMTASKEWRGMMGKQRDTYPRNVLSQMTRFVLKVNNELNNNLS